MDLNNYYIAAQFPEGGYVDVGSDLGVALDASAEFTLESWIRISEVKQGINLLNCENYFRFGVDNEKLVVWIQGLPPVSGATTNNEIGISDWHHVAAVYNLQHMRLYIDGICVKTAGISGKGSGTPGTFRIGSEMEGRMRGLRIYNKGLTADEINDSMFGTVSDSYLVADFDFTCNPPLDKKCPQRKITLAGDAAILEVYPSLKLSGNAFAMPSCKEGINPGGNNFDPYTVHALLRISSLRGRQCIFANSLPELDSGMALYLEYDTEQQRMWVKSLRGSDIEESDVLVSHSMVSINQWVSVATVYDGEHLRIYINGEKDAEGMFGPILVSTYRGNPVVGGRFQGGELVTTDSLQGNISRLEVWNKALSDEEIKQYVGTLPEPDSPSLVCLFDFSVYHVKNEVDNAPLCMSDGAIIWEYTSPARKDAKERNVLKNRVVYDADATLLQTFRQQVDFSLPENDQMALSFPEDRLLQELALLLPENFDVADTASRFKRNWEKELKAGVQRFRVTQHREGKEFFIAVHYPDYSYVAYRCRMDQIDECVLYKVRLVFTIVVGIADVLLGIKPTLTDKAVTFIQKSILTLPQVVTLMSAGTTITVAQLFSIGKTLVSKGILKELFKMILIFGFWSLVRLAARLILSFLGVGAAAMIASLAATVLTFTILFVEFLRHCLPFPRVALYGIKFNHNLAQHQTSALNIRISQAVDVQIPEWVPARQHPAAYAINQVAGNVTIQAKFSIDAILPKTVNIRATAVNNSVLGDVAQFACVFAFGSSNYVNLQVAFNGAAIGSRIASWDWEYYDDQANLWQPMGNSTNNVYLVLNTPLLPWTQEADLASRTLPSEQALQLACGWANGVNAVINIPPQVAQSFYNDAHFIYGRGMYSGISVIGIVNFQIHQFLNDYNNLGNMFIECTDCAVATAVFTKLLGGNIHVVTLIRAVAGNAVDTTFIKAIGVPGWQAHNFDYHVLNTTANLFANNSPVIDACIQVNGDNDPWVAPAPAPAVAFIPGEPARAMQYTTQPIPAVEALPYLALNSYRERFLLNNVPVKNINTAVYNNFQFM